jgi:hypothetical protein
VNAAPAAEAQTPIQCHLFPRECPERFFRTAVEASGDDHEAARARACWRSDVSSNGRRRPVQAEQVILSRSTVDDGYAKLRKNCDQRGRCWTEGRRNPLLDSYNFVTPPRRVTSNAR